MRRSGAILREAGAFSFSRKASSLLVAVLAGAICVLGIMTAGQSAVTRAELDRALDSAGSKVLQVFAKTGPGLFSAAVVDCVASLAPVDTAVGVTTAIDVVSGVRKDGELVPLWQVTGDISRLVTLTSGRWPESGEALVSVAALYKLGFDAGAGYVSSGEIDFPVVGVYESKEPFGEFATGMLVAASGDAPGASRLIVAAVDHSQAAWVESQTLRIVAPPSRDDIQIESPVSLASLQNQVGSGFTGYATALFALVLCLGVSMIAVVVLVDVLMLRSDLGRRRALGATRAAIAALVILRTAIPAIVGTVIGMAIGLCVGWSQNEWPGVEFSVGLGLLCLIAVLVASILPALVAVTQDPVKALRTP